MRLRLSQCYAKKIATVIKTILTNQKNIYRKDDVR